MALNGTTLNQMGCQTPGCLHQHHRKDEPFWFHARCHIKAGMDVSYHANGVMVLRCQKCKSLVAEIEVAP